MNNKSNFSSQNGFTLMETMVAVSLVIVALVGISSFNLYSIYAANQIKKSALADHLAVEAMEAIRSFRNNTTWANNGIGSLTTGADYYPTLLIGTASSSWQMLSGIENIDGYDRRIVFETVSRDPVTEHIEDVYVALNDDPATRKITVYVSWDNKSKTIISYITSWLE